MPRAPVYRTAAELTPAEIYARDQAVAKGEAAPDFETPESIETRAAELRAAGFEHEAQEAEAQLADESWDDPAAILARDRAASGR